MRMLVLSRRLGEKLVLPSVPATVQVVSVHGAVVRLGVEAPTQVPVLREEICPEPVRSFTQEGEAPQPADARLDKLKHIFRNRLNNLGLGLALLKRQVLSRRPSEGVQGTLQRLDEEYQALIKQLKSVLPEWKDVLPERAAVSGQRS